jgi:hypothetical protein
MPGFPNIPNPADVTGLQPLKGAFPIVRYGAVSDVVQCFLGRSHPRLL